MSDEILPAPDVGEHPADTLAFPAAVINAPEPALRIIKNLDPVGARDRVLEVHRHRLRYVIDSKKLLVHDGQRYGDFPHIVDGLALDVLTNVHREFEPGLIHLTEDGQEVSREAILKFQGKLRTRGMLGQVLKLAGLDTSIQVHSQAFDANPYEINTLSGVLDLIAGKISTHSPTQLLTKLAPISWDPNAPCAFWEGFIMDIARGDGKLAAYLQRMFGYCLSGSTQEEVLPIFHGPGANGKSICIAALSMLLGENEYAYTLSPDTLLSNNVHGKTYDKRQLESKRFAAAIEINKGQSLDEAMAKSLVGGDRINARAVHENNATFKSQAKIILAVNHLPTIIGNDRGISRRVQVVPFNNMFDGLKRKEDIERSIVDEKTGIFAWAVRGFQDWYQQGLNPPKVVKDATEEYLKSNQHINAYLEERTNKTPGCSTELKMLYEDYKYWAEDSGDHILGKKQFGEAVQSNNYAKKRSNGKWRFFGISIKHI